MAVDEKIKNSMTVREILDTYPETAGVFDKYGLGGCGGPDGPVEPVGFFARVHQVDSDRLLQELNEAASKRAAKGEANETHAHQIRRAAVVEAPPDIYRPFVKAALVIALTVGCTLGAVNLAAMALGASAGTTWTALTQAHGHAQIFGWVGLFIMGIAYHVIPRLKAAPLFSRPLAIASFWLVLAGIALRMVAQPFATNSVFSSLVVASSLLEFAGAAIFVFVIGKTMAASQNPADFFEKWIIASAIWFLALAAATVGLAVYAFQTGQDAITGAWNGAYLHAALLGFVATMIFGVTLRTVPAFMGLKAPNKTVFNVIFWVFNLAVAVETVAVLVQGGWPNDGTGAAMVGASVVEYLSILAFVHFLNIFRKPVLQAPEGGLERGHEKFIKAAYGWLLVAATMSVAYALIERTTGSAVPHSLVGAYRHALTVGFISMIIIGMSARMVAVFNGARLHSPRLLDVTFVLLNVGNTLRVVSQPLADGFGGVFYATMGVSGFIEVTALALYGYNVWRTMDQRKASMRAEISSTAEIRSDMLVLDVLERFPNTLAVFLKNGFTPLGDPAARRIRAQGVTVDMAARVHSIDPERLVADLNKAK